jgi:DNA ligase-1
MESTFGLPHYVLPAATEIEQSILRFIHESIADHATPILLGYSLGKAQEIAAILTAHNLPFVSSKTVCEMTQACREAGCHLPAPILWDGDIPAGTTLIAPPQILKQAQYFQIPNPRTCMMTGWAINPSAKFRYGTHAAIPLSDHADFPDLLHTVEIVKPKKIITIHGSTRELASSLRQRGYNAWSHYGNDQLDLPFL